MLMINGRYVRHDTLIWEYLNSSIHLVSRMNLWKPGDPFILDADYWDVEAPYLEKKLRKIYEGEAYKFYRQSDKVPLTHFRRDSKTLR